MNIPIGKTTFRSQGIEFGIKPADRRLHMYVIGQTGTGKSTLIKNMALSLIHISEPTRPY